MIRDTIRIVIIILIGASVLFVLKNHLETTATSEIQEIVPQPPKSVLAPDETFSALQDMNHDGGQFVSLPLFGIFIPRVVFDDGIIVSKMNENMWGLSHVDIQDKKNNVCLASHQALGVLYYSPDGRDVFHSSFVIGFVEHHGYLIYVAPQDICTSPTPSETAIKKAKFIRAMFEVSVPTLKAIAYTDGFPPRFPGTFKQTNNNEFHDVNGIINSYMYGPDVSIDSRRTSQGFMTFTKESIDENSCYTKIPLFSIGDTGAENDGDIKSADGNHFLKSTFRDAAMSKSYTVAKYSAYVVPTSGPETPFGDCYSVIAFTRTTSPGVYGYDSKKTTEINEWNNYYVSAFFAEVENIVRHITLPR